MIDSRLVGSRCRSPSAWHSYQSGGQKALSRCAEGESQAGGPSSSGSTVGSMSTGGSSGKTSSPVHDLDSVPERCPARCVADREKQL